MALKEKLDIIAKLRAEWDALQPISKENDARLWKKFRLEWDYNSNHIEGNTLTYGETILLIINGKTTGDHELREYEEMTAHDVAVHGIKEWSTDKTRELTETDIRNLNKIILVRPYWKEAITSDGQPTRREIKIGEYKSFPNSVRLKTGEIFQYASPEKTPQLMEELIDWFRKNKSDNPILVAPELHYRFIRIHPFDDGNGRIARLLVNYVLMREDLPPIIVKSSDKENYLTALQKADAGDREAFHEYMAEQLIWSLEIANKSAKGESIAEEDDLNKKVVLIERQIANKTESIKSDESLTYVWENCLYPFIELYFSRFSVFDKLFNDKETRIFLQLKSKGNYLSLRQLIDWFNNKESEKKDITLIQVHYDFNDLKKAHFSVRSLIQINFEPTRYSIEIEDNSINKKYYELIHEDEMKKFIDESANLFLQRIEKEISKIG